MRQYLYRIQCSRYNEYPLEKYIAHFYHNVPLPLARHPGVLYRIGLEQTLFCIGPKYGLPCLDFKLDIIFRCLSVENVIILIGLLLLERQIVKLEFNNNNI